MFETLMNKLKAKKVDKSLTLIKDLPNNKNKAFHITQTKELTEVENFLWMLKLFEDHKLQRFYIQQNINDTIISFRPTVFDTCDLLHAIVVCLKKPNLETINSIRRLARISSNSYLFFHDRDETKYALFTQETIDLMVQWMKEILLFYEEHKLGINDLGVQDTDDNNDICLALSFKLDIFYDFFYCLLCHIVNIKCDHLSSIATIVQIEF